MRKALVVLAALLVAAVSVPPSTWAAALTNTAITDAQFGGFAGQPILLSQTGSSAFIGGTEGIIDSAAFTGVGAAAGLYIYTYRLTMLAGDIFAVTTPIGGAANVVGTLDVGGDATADTSFKISGGLLAGSALQSFYGTNGDTGPDVAGVVDATGALKVQWFSTIIAPSASSIWGFISTVAPALVVADAVDGGPTTSSPLVVAPAPPVPEPGTLLLLGSGLTSLAALGWRRKRSN